MNNFRRAAGKSDLPFQGYVYNDSDVYKWLEAACWVAGDSSMLGPGDNQEPNRQLAALVDEVTGLIAAAQLPDGYLNTYFSLDKASRRWTNLRDQHELYCAGHLIQAAIAAQRGREDGRLLAVARRLADHLAAVFGPQEQGLRPGVAGHPEIEMALVELARQCAEPRYLELANFFLDQRGHGLIGGQIYHLDHRPYRQLERLDGHAVRALYLSAGAADLFAERGDETLLASLERTWEQLFSRQAYITGGVGARYSGESLGEDYELPNARAYAETCAAIASVMWNWRMLQLKGQARYADALETALYNGALSGISLDGKSYFYQNPLADNGRHRRLPWFACACCPTNIVRLLAMLPGYCYSLSETGIWVHLYVAGKLEGWKLGRSAAADYRAESRLQPDTRKAGRSRQEVALEVRTAYPWDGQVEIEMQAAGEFSLSLRIPGWAGTGDETSRLEVNGQSADIPISPGSYAKVRRNWQSGDVLRLQLPVQSRWMESHPFIQGNLGRLALQRGPLVYCFERADNPGIDLREACVLSERPVDAEFRQELLGGVVRLQVEASRTPVEPEWGQALYRRVVDRGRGFSRTPWEDLRLTAIPYYAWANRQPGQMQVWMAQGSLY